MNAIVHDQESLFQAREFVRAAFVRVRRLSQADPTVREVANQLDELCVEITEAIDLENPRLPLGEKQADYEAHRRVWTAGGINR